jgi:hypothetical protein
VARTIQGRKSLIDEFHFVSRASRPSPTQLRKSSQTPSQIVRSGHIRPYLYERKFGAEPYKPIRLREGHSRRSGDTRLSPIVDAMEPLRLGVPELADD